MIVFKYHRLRVGHRREDWSDVWYEPNKETEPDDDDDFAGMCLYKSARGPKTPNEPMEGEVVWIANFDIANCESKIAKERVRMHRITLYRAWKYCDETDPEAIYQLEEDLHKPDCRRWQSWFTHAKKWKREKMRKRKSKRKEMIGSEPVRVMVVDGTPPSELNVTSGSEDSAYGSEAERRFAEERRKRRMPPPSRPSDASNRKRRGSGSSSGTPKQKKKSRAKPTGRGKHSEEDDLPDISGGLGRRSWTPRYNDPNGLGYIMNAFDDDDARFGNPSGGKNNTRLYQTTVEDLTGDDEDGEDHGSRSIYTDFDPSPPQDPLPPTFHPRASSAVTSRDGMLPTPRLTANQRQRHSEPLEVPRPHISRSGHSAPGMLGHGITGYGARMAAKRNGPGSGSSAGEGEMARPAQPILTRSERGASVIEPEDYQNGGLDDDAALEEAVRQSSQMPEFEQEQIRREMAESVVRGAGETAAAVRQDGQGTTGDSDDEDDDPGED